MDSMRRVRPKNLAGLCVICAGTGMMPRSAPAHVRVACLGCGGEGATA